MKLKNYYNNEFQQDLKNLKLQRPKGAVGENPEHFHIDESTVFFGRRNWLNFKDDIAYIKDENLESFLLCLFMQTVIDLTMHEYYPEHYQSFRSKTFFLKFGWVGYGPHFESPTIILMVPYNKGIVKFNDSALVDEFIQLFLDECKKYLSNLMPEIEVSDFIKYLLNDRQFQVSPDEKGKIFRTIYRALEKAV